MPLKNHAAIVHAQKRTPPQFERLAKGKVLGCSAHLATSKLKQRFLRQVGDSQGLLVGRCRE